MKCMQNPISKEIKRVSESEARKLAGYGWTYTTKAAWKSQEQTFKVLRENT